MATREELKSYFETNDIPTQEQFAELIDSMAIVGEDNSGSVSAIIGQSWNNTQKALARSNIGFDDALDDWIVTWDSIENGVLPLDRLPSVVGRKDQAGTWTQAQTVPGGLVLGQNSNAGSINIDSGYGFVIRGKVGSTADFAITRGDGTIVLHNNVGTNNVNFSGGATFNNTVVVNNAGTGRVVYGPDSYIQGNASELQILQLGSGSLYQDFGASVIFRRTSDFATMATLTNGGNLTTRGSVNARYGVSISEAATGDLSWILYRNDGGPTQPLYLLDAANSRSQMYFTPASTDANASTHILSKLFVTQLAEFGKGINATGPYPHGSFGVPGVISYEYPFTRNMIGDGSGYSWALSKRAGGVTTDVLTVNDASELVSVRSSLTTGGTVTASGSRPITLDGSTGFVKHVGDAGGWAQGASFAGPNGTVLAEFGMVGSGNTISYGYVGSFASPWLKVTSAGFLELPSSNRIFQDSGNLYIESDGGINLRDYSSGVSLWRLANDGRTFAKINVWHSDSEGNPRIVYNGSGGATHFYGGYNFISSTRLNGFHSDGTITWGQDQVGNARGLLSWDANKAVISAPLNLDFIGGGLTRYIALDGHEFNTKFGFSDSRFERPSAASTALKTYEASLSAWQQPWIGRASASGPTIGFLGATDIVRQTLPAAATDAATTQTLANALRDLAINFGLAN